MAHLDIRIPLRWSDLDAYGHVNNAATAGLLEEARIQAFWRPTDEEAARGAAEHPTAIPELGVDGSLLSFIASQHIEYPRPIPFHREGVVVRLWLSRFGGASLDVDYLILPVAAVEHGGGADQTYVRARTTIVLVDRSTQQPSRIPDTAREALTDWTDEPLAFRG